MTKIRNDSEKEFRGFLSRASRWAARSERCRSEVLLKLNTWGVEAAQARKILAFLEKERYVDEQRFTHAFIHDKYNFQRWGRHRLIAELKARDIPGYMIEEGLKQLEQEDYVAILDKLLNNKAITYGDIPRPLLWSKLASFAARKGYEPSLVYERISLLLGPGKQ